MGSDNLLCGVTCKEEIIHDHGRDKAHKVSFARGNHMQSVSHSSESWHNREVGENDECDMSDVSREAGIRIKWLSCRMREIPECEMTCGQANRETEPEAEPSRTEQSNAHGGAQSSKQEQPLPPGSPAQESPHDRRKGEYPKPPAYPPAQGVAGRLHQAQ